MDSDTYTIKQIYTQDITDSNGEPHKAGEVVVVFDCDGKEQTLSNVPLDSEDSVKRYLSKYLAAYKSGKESESVKLDKGIKALIGKEQTAEVVEQPTQDAEEA